MHIFLKGSRGIGKSTVINRAAALLAVGKPLLTIGGFITYKGSQYLDKSDPYIYIKSAGDSDNTKGFQFAKFDGSRLTCYSDVLDSYGVNLLQNSRGADLIYMDELGYLERDALAFQREVFCCLDCGSPVAGVLRDQEIPWHKDIVNRPDVTVIRITEANRGTMHELLADMLAPYIK
jgi:nucleoside-triphosphatase